MGGFFYGWYLKCQSGTQTLAVIPAIHRTGKTCTCSVQIITDRGAWTIPFPAGAYKCDGDIIAIGKNRFGKQGIRLAIRRSGMRIRGKLDFGPLSPLKYDIMGPFVLVPFLECRHSVWSMKHSVCGTVYVNEQEYKFQNAWGYWEGDRGRSFPQKYVWTQCCFAGGSLMLSIADIPVLGMHFNGIICIVLWQGREYRLATYLGARVVCIRNGVVRITQRNMELEAKLLESFDNPLKAPKMGNMVRIIRESAACRALYRFRIGKQTLFEIESDRASFEYEYPN